MKTVCLVLSGGGARGFFHVGVIKALEELNVEISKIIGASMGSVVGAAYALDKDTVKLQQLASEFCCDHKKYLNVKTGSIKLKTEHLIEFFHILYSNSSQEDVKIPLDIIVADYHTARPIILRHGLLRDNVLASVSIPFLNKPVKIGENYYIDPGFVSNFPVEFYKEKYGSLVGINIRNSKLNVKIATNFIDKIVKKNDIINVILSAKLLNNKYEKEKILKYSEYGIIFSKDLITEIKSTDFHKVNEIIDAGYKYIHKHKNLILEKLQ